MASYTTSKHKHYSNTSTACDTSRIKVDITDAMVLRKMIRSSYVYNSNPPIISCNNIVLTITTALYAGSVYHSYINIVLNIIPTLYEGYIVSAHRMVMENRPVDPGSIQGSHRPISFIRLKHRTRANDILCKTEF